MTSPSYTLVLTVLYCSETSRPESSIHVVHQPNTRKPKVVREALDRRDEDHAPLDRIIELDERRRVILTSSEALRARRNQVSKELSKMKEKPPEVIQEGDASGRVGR